MASLQPAFKARRESVEGNDRGVKRLRLRPRLTFGGLTRRETGAFAWQEQDGLEEQSRSCSATMAIRNAFGPCFDVVRRGGR